jgi:hypothetical protein
VTASTASPDGVTDGYVARSTSSPEAGEVARTGSGAVLHVPSLGRRVAWGSVRAAVTIVVLVVVPWYLLGLVGGYGVSTPVPIAGLAVLGILFATLGALRYIGRPTRAFGPLTIGASLVSIVYLLYLIPIASIGLQHGNDIDVSIYFGRFLQYCLLVPLFGVAAGAVTTVEDLFRPNERIEYEYSI